MMQNVLMIFFILIIETPDEKATFVQIFLKFTVLFFRYFKRTCTCTYEIKSFDEYK